MGGSGSNSGNAAGASTSPEDPKNWVKYHGEADKVWKQVFGEDAFTSLPIANLVLNNTATSLEDYLKQPKILKGKVSLEKIVGWDNLGVLADGPGRCASFAVKVCRKLESQYANKYDFRYYNIGQHRIARCEKTRVVIDSSSELGAFQLTSNDLPMWWREREQQWEHEAPKGTMHFKKDRHDPKGKVVSGPQIKWNEAIAMSVNGLATNAKPQLATLFREIVAFTKDDSHIMETIFHDHVQTVGQPHGKTKYRAMLRWDVKGKSLQCWKSLNAEDQSNVLIVSWNGKGSQALEEDAMSLVHNLVISHGVRHQWVTKNATANQQHGISLEEMHWTVWRTATNLWGAPTYEFVDMSKK